MTPGGSNYTIHAIAARLLPRVRLRHLVLLCLAVDLFTSFVWVPRSGIGYWQEDVEGYSFIARSILSCGTFTYHCGMPPTVFRGPAYPAVLALWSAPFGAVTQGWSTCLHILLNLSALALLVRLARDRFGPTAGTIAGLLYCFFPLHHIFLSRYFTETLLVPLVLLAAVLLLRSNTRSGWGALFAASVVLAAALLTKQGMVVLLPAAALMVWSGSRSMLKSALIVLLPMLLIVPWTLRNASLTGRAVPVHVGAGVNLALGNGIARKFMEHPFRTKETYEAVQRDLNDAFGRDVLATGWEGEVEIEEALLRSGIGELLADPLFAGYKLLLGIVLFIAGGMSPLNSFVLGCSFLVVLPFAIRGYRMREKRTPFDRFAVAAIVLTSLAHAVILSGGRFSLPVMPFVLLYAAAGLRSLLVPEERPFPASV